MNEKLKMGLRFMVLVVILLVMIIIFYFMCAAVSIYILMPVTSWMRG